MGHRQRIKAASRPVTRSELTLVFSFCVLSYTRKCQIYTRDAAATAGREWRVENEQLHASGTFFMLL